MKNLAVLFFLLSTACFANTRSEFISKVIQSVHSKKIAETYKLEELNTLLIRCIQSPEDEYYIGVEQMMVVRSKLDDVKKIIEDFSSYPKLFHDLKDVRVTPLKEGHFFTSWTAKPPVFFVSDPKYELEYHVNQINPKARVYKYNLHKSDQLTASDGMVYLKEISPNLTLYYELDFINANWGLLKTVAPGSIWPRIVKEFVHADYAIKTKAENPEWSLERARDQAEQQLEFTDVQGCVGKKLSLAAFQKESL